MRTVTATVVLLAAGLCQAEEKTLFQEYGEAFVGQWEGEGTLVADVPGLGIKGDKITPTTTIRWILKKNALETNWTCGDARGRGLTVWDPAEKQIRSYWSSSMGIIGQSVTSKQGEKWVTRASSVFPDGTRQSGTNTITVTDGGDTHLHVGTDGKRGDEALPDSKATWKRVKKSGTSKRPRAK